MPSVPGVAPVREAQRQREEEEEKKKTSCKLSLNSNLKLSFSHRNRAWLLTTRCRSFAIRVRILWFLLLLSWSDVDGRVVEQQTQRTL